MCRPAAALLVGALIISAGSRVAAQDLRDLERRVDSALARQHAATRERLEHYRMSRPATGTFQDTVAVANGRFVVLSRPDIGTEARAAATWVDSVFRRQLGPETTALRGDTFTVRRDTSARGMAIVGYIAPSGASVSRGAPATVKGIAQVMAEQITTAFVDRSKSPFAKWHRGPVILDPVDGHAQPDWSTVRFSLISSPTTVARRCYAGDLDACTMVVGLKEVEFAAMAWYDSLGRFETVRRSIDFANRIDRLATARCLQGSDKDCAEVMRASNSLAELPASGFFRASLIAHALTVGGDGAAGRMLATNGTPSDALAAASRLPIDTLVSRWQQNTRAQAISSRDLSLRIVLISLGWVVILGLLALRSSRWR